MWKGHSRGNVASNCKTSEKSQNIGLWVDLSKYIAPLANEGNIMSFQDDLSGGSLNKNQPNLISKLLPLKTTINIPMIISYITKFQCLKFGFWVVTSTLQTSIQLDLSKKICRSSAMVTELEVTCIFRANLREIGCGKLGVKPTAPNGLAQL